MNYRMMYRPPGFATLPSGVKWSWVELPPDHPNPQRFPELPVSKWQFGVFKPDVLFNEDELRDYQIEEVL